MDPLATKREVMSLERYIGIVVVLSLLLIIFSAGYFAEADGYKQSGKLEKTPETFYLRGDLTAKTENKTYGGEIIGDYLVVVNFENVKVMATLDEYSQSKILEGWLFDKTAEKLFNVGTFDGNKLSSEIIVESWTYDEILIIEKLIDDSNEAIPVGGALLKKSPEYHSCKCF
jgi:hypothetical protein